MPTKQVLFVDDEAKVLDGLRRMLRKMRSEWDMTFVESGREALEYMARSPVDVIVSDMRMPEMDGIQLLERVRRMYPDTVRVILSGFSDQELTLRSAGTAHQFLSKPCEAETVTNTISRACALRELLANPELQRVVGGVRSVPALPELYARVLEVVSAPDASVREVGAIIAKDLGMTAKVLQLVNSAFFGLRHRVTSPVQAVSLLGLDTIKALVIGAEAFSQFADLNMPGLTVEALYERSTRVGALAQQIARAARLSAALAADALLAGMLHDIGILVLMANLADRYHEVLQTAFQEHQPLWIVESERMGFTHAEVGAYLLGIWGLPDSIVEAVAFHHRPQTCAHAEFTVLTATHLAHGLLDKCAPALVGDGKESLDKTYIESLGLTSRVSEWAVLAETVNAMERTGVET